MSPVKKQIHFIFLTAVCDITAIVLSFAAAYLLRFISGLIPSQYSAAPITDYLTALCVILPVYLWIFRAYGLYSAERQVRRIEEIFKVIKAVSLSVLVLMAITFFYRNLSYSRVYLVILWILSTLMISLGRYFLIQWEYHRKQSRNDIAKVLLIGVNRNTRSIITWANSNPHYGQEIVGILAKETEMVGKHLLDVPILGVATQSENFILTLKPNRVILLDTHFTREEVAELVDTCEDQLIDFKIAADLFGLMSRNVDVDYVSSIPLIGFRSLPLDDFWNRSIKRFFDVVASAIILILTFPIWLAVILAIKLDDRGPILYSQERIGRDLAKFNLLKFRTMKVDAEKETGPVWAKPNDGRRTRIGNFLRRWNIDELPQLLNVLRGEMSLVGPRPERPHFTEKFRGMMPRYMTRHKIKSGLTGWAQVSGLRGDTSIEERLKYDLYYMENWSLLFDLEILVMTFAAFKNAY